MWRSSFCSVAVLVCAVAFPAMGQSDWSWSAGVEPQQANNWSGPLPTPAEVLTQHHIPLTKDGLLSALHSEDGEIRDLAAFQLEEQEGKEAIPDIVAALKAEQVPLTRVNMAAGLAYMGDQRGFESLKQDCDDQTLPMHFRLQAADQLLMAHGESCPQTVLLALQNTTFDGTEMADRAQALSIIPHFKKSPDLSTDDSAQFWTLALKSLSDPAPFVRMQAGETLRWLGDEAALP